MFEHIPLLTVRYFILPVLCALINYTRKLNESQAFYLNAERHQKIK